MYHVYVCVGQNYRTISMKLGLDPLRSSPDGLSQFEAPTSNFTNVIGVIVNLIGFL